MKTRIDIETSDIFIMEKVWDKFPEHKLLYEQYGVGRCFVEFVVEDELYETEESKSLYYVVEKWSRDLNKENVCDYYKVRCCAIWSE